MITGVRIQNFRGIRAGELMRLGGLTILLGANGSGMSTILDALSIGASFNPGDAVGRTVRRRMSAPTSARWLLWKSGAEGPARIETDSEQGCSVLSIRDIPRERPVRASVAAGDYSMRVEEGGLGTEPTPSRFGCRVVFTDGEAATARVEYDVMNVTDHDRPNRFVCVIDPAPGRNQSDLGRILDGLKDAAGRAAIDDLLRDVAPDFTGLVSLHDDKGRPIVHIVYGGDSPRTVPVELAGDGIYGLTRIALELASCPPGLALLEEPEVHQFPKSLWRMAQAITAAVARGVQVVITTHSAELISMLLEQASERSLLDRTAVVKVLIRAGQLVSSRLGGTDAFLAVDSLGEDLR